MTVCVYVEGGGPGDNTQTACRKAFRTFLEKLSLPNRSFRVTACGSREETYQDFCRATRHAHENSIFPLLLVDSENPVANATTSSEHLKQQDKWRADSLPNRQTFLMVQCMEAWFLADTAALRVFYGNQAGTFQGNPNIEDIPKQDVLNRLKIATRNTSKGAYDKSSHGFKLLERLDPEKVAQASRHAKDLFAALRELCAL